MAQAGEAILTHNVAENVRFHIIESGTVSVLVGDGSAQKKARAAQLRVARARGLAAALPRPTPEPLGALPEPSKP